MQVIAAEKFADEISKDGKAALDGDLQKLSRPKGRKPLIMPPNNCFPKERQKERLAADQEPEKEEAKKQAARRAVMQIIAAEKSRSRRIKET